MIALTFILTHPRTIHEVTPANASHSKDEQGGGHGRRDRQRAKRRREQRMKAKQATRMRGGHVVLTGAKDENGGPVG